MSWSISALLDLPSLGEQLQTSHDVGGQLQDEMMEEEDEDVETVLSHTTCGGDSTQENTYHLTT